MTWNCPVCSAELGELNAKCEYCYYRDGSIVYNPDKYYIRDVFVRHIGTKIMDDYHNLSEPQVLESIDNNVNMTPQEKLFAKLFYHETMLVKDMDLLTLRAHREELSKIAFEARARLSAADATEEKIKRSKRAESKPQGFERSLNTDDTSTAAINTIKERQSRQTKAEKTLASLLKAGISEVDAQKLMQAGTILARLKNKTPEEISATLPTPPDPNAPKMFNPFAKKEDGK